MDLLSNITVREAALSLLAVPAFIPAALAIGYVFAWFSNLHGFRRRSLAERIVWSIPLSLSLSAISSELIARFFSVTAASVVLLLISVVWIGLLIRERSERRRMSDPRNAGWKPYRNWALILALLWIALTIFSLVDFAADHRLFMSYAMWDQGVRFSWTQCILGTGVPPSNWFYLYKHPATLRNYYFWYVMCAAICRLWHLPVRAVFTASCVWSGFGLAALVGLYLKHFLNAGEHLRKQFLIAFGLLGVTGLDVLGMIYFTGYLHKQIPLNFEMWSADAIFSWLNTQTWAPHHLAGAVCCMFAFLLAWMGSQGADTSDIWTTLFAGAALASAFGISVYAAFAFFLIMLLWGLWQILVERKPRMVILLAIGGAIALVLLSSYLWELSHTPSYVQGRSPFQWTVRQMIPPDQLLATSAFRHLSVNHPLMARNLANLVLLLPGYVVELGFYALVLLIFLVPRWRGVRSLDAPHRSLIALCIASVPVMTFIRSAVITNNDFGWRAALYLQFPLLLLGSELLVKRNRAPAPKESESAGVSLTNAPGWVRMTASLFIVIGIVSTVGQLILLRFGLPWMEASAMSLRMPNADRLSRTAYMSETGYSQLDSRIPRNAVVQFNPAHLNGFYTVIDEMGVDHQTAIAMDRGGCGSTFGGDSAGCPKMAGRLDSLFRGGSADAARSVCRDFGIRYLVVRVYDPAWNDAGGWVWSLPAVVADDDFRALDCR